MTNEAIFRVKTLIIKITDPLKESNSENNWALTVFFLSYP